ncbi:hypothetical protein HMPREF3150_02753 [Pseudomonas aeruginosa]|nr:hypothetical protein HMPREF3150_02753 [Pseudomonas aeruginosa]
MGAAYFAHSGSSLFLRPRLWMTLAPRRARCRLARARLNFLLHMTFL